MYPTVDKLKLHAKTQRASGSDAVMEYWIIPVKESTYNLLCNVARNAAYIDFFVKKNPHLAEKIDKERIIINNTVIKWENMIEVMEVAKDVYPSDIANYCKLPRAKYEKSVPHFYDYHAGHYEYCGVGYTTVAGMWLSIWEALNKPKHILLFSVFV